jgi:hypothetical protein
MALRPRPKSARYSEARSARARSTHRQRRGRRRLKKESQRQDSRFFGRAVITVLMRKTASLSGFKSLLHVSHSTVGYVSW